MCCPHCGPVSLASFDFISKSLCCVVFLVIMIGGIALRRAIFSHQCDGSYRLKHVCYMNYLKHLNKHERLLDN